MTFRRPLLISACLLLSACATIGAPTPQIDTSDVTRFYALYDRTGGRPTAEQVKADYFDPGSEGLHTLARLRSTTPERIAQAIAQKPELYARARECARVLPAARRRIAVSLKKLQDIYPEARTPPVTITIGRGRPMGVGGQTTGLQIGLEALCAADFFHADLEDRFVYIIAHEYVHVQQPPDLNEAENLTVLEASLVEGAAEFVGLLISGDVGYAHLHRRMAGRGAEVEAAFVKDMDSRDLSHWLYNTGQAADPDLGYWVGYRIAAAYYDKAADKRRAVREIIGLTDAKAFLAASGWRPGIKLTTLPPR